MNEFFSIGLKVVAAVVAGGAVFVGLGKVFGDNKTSNQRTDAQGSNVSDCDDETSECQVSENSQSMTTTDQNQSNEKSSGEKVVECLRKTQETCSRALNIIQSVTAAVDCIVRAFGKPGTVLPNNGYGHEYLDKYKDPPGFRRISPYILEYVGNSNYHTNNYNGGW